ncbi:hypothetical protein [Falsihalocynthiibacter arcticus]|uniref:hypothetical protein n=1 Tax=Falsihalocynthiibacter arcticus TaxID=1579316 RepID=UPI003001CECD
MSQIAKTPPRRASGQIAGLPCPAVFRLWLRASLTALDLSPSAYGPELGLGKNTLGHFLGGEGRDLRLGTAATLAHDLMARAKAESTPLGKLEGVAIDG